MQVGDPEGSQLPTDLEFNMVSWTPKTNFCRFLSLANGITRVESSRTKRGIGIFDNTTKRLLHIFL